MKRITQTLLHGSLYPGNTSLFNGIPFPTHIERHQRLDFEIAQVQEAGGRQVLAVLALGTKRPLPTPMSSAILQAITPNIDPRSSRAIIVDLSTSSGIRGFEQGRAFATFNIP